jgi:hypothetical protein
MVTASDCVGLTFPGMIDEPARGQPTIQHASQQNRQRAVYNDILLTQSILTLLVFCDDEEEKVAGHTGLVLR